MLCQVYNCVKNRQAIAKHLYFRKKAGAGFCPALWRGVMKSGTGTVAIIVAAGVGTRAGLGIPKQYAPLGGRAVVAHSYAALAGHAHIGRVIVVIGPGREEQAHAALAGVSNAPELVIGGETRRDSVREALEYLARSGGCERVLIHDAARPFVCGRVIDDLLSVLANHQGAIPALTIADTLVQSEDCAAMGEAVAREKLFRVQTPQAFRFDSILRAHRSVSSDAQVTDDAGLLRLLGLPVAMVPGDPIMEKLTYPEDFIRAEALCATRRLPRTGIGYDVHRLVEGKPLWLCGVEIPYARGLSGHSDADVAIHALVDALLGALAEGDIGQHFPPSDPQWKGAASHLFLEFACNRVANREGEIAHVDVTIICEEPKIGPHRESMRARLAELLSLPLSRVSVKATTTERLGFAGRGEGIAAQAVATLLLPEV